ncbi:nucleotidyltransferase family protein [Kribbella sp. NPDC059898]|uniref:nucleotidyltransferase family protein n=1 Tax=Kribbella sp. NPDC059898 TaxID=3346995 RepID=UPI003647D08B
MDMGNPLTTVIQTMDGPALGVLAGTTAPLTGRQVHRLAGHGSERGIRDALNRLARTGLVTATVVGGSIQYTLNRDHLAANAVLELVSLRQRLIEHLRGTIAAWPISPTHASLFGSTARGDGNLDSDIDLLIVYDPDPTADHQAAWEEQLSDLGEETRRRTGNWVQLYEIDTSGLIDHLAADEPIVRGWTRDAITLHGPSIRTVIHRAAFR